MHDRAFPEHDDDRPDPIRRISYLSTPTEWPDWTPPRKLTMANFATDWIVWLGLAIVAVVIAILGLLSIPLFWIGTASLVGGVACVAVFARAAWHVIDRLT
jgi:hypothetical protein